MAKGLEHEILTGIAAYKALKPDGRDNYYNQLAQAAKRENDDYDEKIRNREATIAAGKPQQPTAGVPPAISHSGMPGSPMPLPDEPFNPAQRQTRADRTGQTMRFAGGGLAGGLTKGFKDTFQMPRRPQAIIIDRWGPRDRPSDAGIPGSTDAAQNAALTYGPAPAYRRGGRVRRYQEGGVTGGDIDPEQWAAPAPQLTRQDSFSGSANAATGNVSGTVGGSGVSSESAVGDSGATGGVGGSASSDAGVGGSAAAGTGDSGSGEGGGTYRRGGRVRPRQAINTGVRRYQEGGEVAAQFGAEEETAQEQRRRQDQATANDIIREMISAQVGEPDVHDPSIELRERAERDQKALSASIPTPQGPRGRPVEYTPPPDYGPDPSAQLNQRGAADRAELEAKYRTAIPAPPDAGDLDPSAEYTRMGEEEAAIRRQDDTGLHQSTERYGPPSPEDMEDPLSRPRIPRSNIGPPTQVPPAPSEPLPDVNRDLERPPGKPTSMVGRALNPIVRRARGVGAEVAADMTSGLYRPSTTYGTGDPANAYPDYNEDPEFYQELIRRREIDKQRVGPMTAVSPEEEARRNAEVERLKAERDRPVPVPGTPAYQQPYTGPRNEPAVRTGPPTATPAAQTNAPAAPAAPAAPGGAGGAAAAQAPGQPAATGAKPRVGDTQTDAEGRRLFWNGKAWVPLSQTEQYGPPEQYGPSRPDTSQMEPTRPTAHNEAEPGGAGGPPKQSVGTNTAGGGAGNTATPPPGSNGANQPTRVEKPETRTRAFNPDIDRRDPTTGATLPAQLDAQGQPVAPSGPGSLGSATGYSNGDIAQTLNGAATQVRPGVNGGPPPIGHNAADRLIFHQYTQAHSQNGKFTPGEAMLAGMVSDYKTLLKQGRIEQANKMAYSLLQAANLEAASFGMQARDQMARGDYRGAQQSMVNGLNYIADGVSQRLSADGQFLESFDPRTGAVTARTPMDGRLILAGIMGLSDGSLFWKTLQASAAMLTKPDKNAEGRALSNDLRRRQIALADQRLGKGNAPRGGGGGTSVGMSQFEKDMRRFRSEPDPTPTSSGGGGGGTDDTLAMVNFDVRDPDDSGGDGG